jgi:hypothetical protein
MLSKFRRNLLKTKKSDTHKVTRFSKARDARATGSASILLAVLIYIMPEIRHQDGGAA